MLGLGRVFVLLGLRKAEGPRRSFPLCRAGLPFLSWLLSTNDDFEAQRREIHLSDVTRIEHQRQGVSLEDRACSLICSMR
jgi:hypothetical protein